MNWRFFFGKTIPIGIFFSVVLGLHYWSLLRYPAPFTDEGWYANRAWAFMSTGKAFGSADAGIMQRYEGHWTYFSWLPNVFRSIPLHIVDQPSLFSLRLLSLFFGVILLLLVFLIGWQLSGRGLGLLSAGIVSLSSSFLYSAHLARDDIISAVFGYLGTVIYLINRRRGLFWAGLLCGLSLGLAFEVHPHSAIFAPAVGLLYIFDLGKDFYKRRHFWGFLAGGFIGAVFFLERHVLRYPATYSAISQIIFHDTHTPPIMTLDLEVLSRAFLETIQLLYFEYPLLFPAIAWGFASTLIGESRSLLDRRSSGKLLLILNTALLIGITLLVRNKFNHYAILVTPALEILFAYSLLRSIQRPWQGRFQDYACRIAGAILLPAVLSNLFVLRADSFTAFQPVEAKIHSLVHDGETIMGPETYWFGLYEHDFPGWEQLVFYQRGVPGSTIQEAFQSIRPDIFILDANMGIFISDQPGASPFQEYYHLPQNELYAFLSENAERLAKLDDPGWVPVEVYRIDWDEQTGEE